VNDLIHSLRFLSKRPRFTVLVVASLSLGLAINTTIFTVVNSLLLQPLPYARPSELVEIGPVPGNVPLAALEGAHSFSGVAGFTTANLPVGPEGDVRPYWVFAARRICSRSLVSRRLSAGSSRQKTTRAIPLPWWC
jgi:hypothetical protein